MNAVLDTLLTLAYLTPTLILMLFGLNMYFTLFLCMFRMKNHRGQEEKIHSEFRSMYSEHDFPEVVTQIPLYNEFNVAERIIRAAAAMEYPAGRHTVQVLDDSTDETRLLVDRVADDLRQAGHRVQVLRREVREGFKAGALAYGMGKTSAGYFAIFDADFVPPKDFLLRMMPVLMVKPHVGVAQARWGHLNEQSSLLTLAQGIGIDAHFAIEQPARAWNNLFMNFNGTAGIWRRRAIDEAGGWQYDTLTEDMDLSYRTQLAGWKVFFLSDLVVDGEIPEDINAFKAQQFRWAKGSIQTAIKLLPSIFRSRHSWLAKIEATFHLTYYGIYPLMLCVALLAWPFYSLSNLHFGTPLFVLLSNILGFTALAPTLVCAVSQNLLHPRGWRRIRYFPMLLSLGIGIAVTNSRAVLEALLRIPSEFVRTPKKGSRIMRRYQARLSFGAVLELVLGAYCFVTLVVLMEAHKYLALPYLFINAAGFTAVGLMSVFHFIGKLQWSVPLATPASE